MSGRSVRVRFAPSPTGFLHMGGARTALFNWLFARHHGGKFILRIEDTDRARSTGEATGAILRSLRWLGLDWDEGPEVDGPHGPYFQSERMERYQKAAEELLNLGAAYPCYCTREELEARRQEALGRGMPPGYDGRCRDLTEEEQRRLEREGRDCTLRFRFPSEGGTSFDDLVYGRISVDNATLDDMIILKADGFPTYNFAAAVDDSAMEISHVIRGDDHIANTPKQILLHRALGGDVPIFSHLPMILGEDKKPLSKRHGATSVEDYRDRGYLPEAMVNFLALLGWSLDDKTEIISRAELIDSFGLDRVSKSGAVFNFDKLDHVNGVYIRRLEDEELAERLIPFFAAAGVVGERPDRGERRRLLAIVPLVRERIKLLTEAPSLVDFLFRETLDYQSDLLVGKKMDVEGSRAALVEARRELEAASTFDPDHLEASLRPLAERLGLKAGQLFGVLRVAITGKTVAPPLFESMALLGKERAMERVEEAVKRLEVMEGR